MNPDNVPCSPERRHHVVSSDLCVAWVSTPRLVRGTGVCVQKKKHWLSLHISVMGDREADKMTLWQFSQEAASSLARGRDRGVDKQMLFITQGWWESTVYGLVCLCMSMCVFWGVQVEVWSMCRSVFGVHVIILCVCLYSVVNMWHTELWGTHKPEKAAGRKSHHNKGNLAPGDGPCTAILLFKAPRPLWEQCALVHMFQCFFFYEMDIKIKSNTWTGFGKRRFLRTGLNLNVCFLLYWESLW